MHGGRDFSSDIYVGERLATLTVIESPSLKPGQVLDISKPTTRIGRGADQDIIVPDGPVSRKQAEIRKEGDTFMVFDEDSRYGTFVNDNQVEPGGLPILDGDRLRLGTRTILQFSTPRSFRAGFDEQTIDEFAEDAFDPDATVEDFASDSFDDDATVYDSEDRP